MVVQKDMMEMCDTPVRSRRRFGGACASGRAGLRARGAQRGQALILAIISLVVLCIGVIVLFNTGQATSKKVQLVNAADATAYSVAVQQARAYNLIAYMNRATVANEVAVAQMVSWYSWMNFTLRGTENFKDAVQAIAVVFDVTVVLAEIGAALQEVVSVLNSVKQVVQQLRDAMQVGFSAGVTAIASLNEVYAVASGLVANVEPQEALKLARELASRNTDGQGKIGARGLGLLEHNIWSARDYAATYNVGGSTRPRGSTAGARYANVVMEARDGFSRRRSDGISLNLGIGSFSLLKRGGTDLVDYRNWVGIDTLDAKARMFCVPLAGCAIKFDVPMAWGGGAAVDRTTGSFRSIASPGINNGRGWDSPYDIDRGHYARYDGGIDNGTAGSMALNSPAIGGQSKAWLRNYASSAGAHVGLPERYQDTAENKATVPYLNGYSASQNGVAALDVGPIFTVLIEQPMNTVRTANNIPGMGGPPDFEALDKTVSDDMTALASAQVFFSRPSELFPRVIDSKRELGSLFSPYWQARLVDTPCATRQEVAVFYGAVAPCIPGSN